MAERFVELSGIKISREKQMAIYGVCRNYKRERVETQETIRALCAEIGGREWGRALFAYLTTGITAQGAMGKYRIPERVLTDMRREFYRRWPL